MRIPALIIAHGYLATPNGKTTHGLLRDSDRYAIQAVIDATSAGRDAGEVGIGRAVGIPVVATLAEALEVAAEPPAVAIIGVATHGGHLEPEIRRAVLEAVEGGLGAVNGLHELLADDPAISSAASRRGLALIDLRAPRPKSELHFWTGAIYAVGAERIAVLGTDCAVGKRTTARGLVAALRARGRTAEMIYTGQTGWLQGSSYGFVLDATPNDYVSGELEHAIVRCDRTIGPDVIVIEGQSSLRNPSGPCGAELLVSADARIVVLQHSPARRFFEGYEDAGLEIPDLASEVALIRAYGAEVAAIALKRDRLGGDRLETYRSRVTGELGIPVVAAGGDTIADIVVAKLGGRPADASSLGHGSN